MVPAKASKCIQSCQQFQCDNCKNKLQKDEELVAKRTHQIEAAILKIKESRQGRAGNIFQMRKQITGPKKGSQEASAIRDPKTGDVIVDKEQIKNATLKYCAENLKNNEPDDGMKYSVNMKKAEQLKIMNNKSGEGFEVTEDDFETVLDKFKTKDTKTYDFLLNAGKRYREAIFLLIKRIIDEEEVPDSFRKTILIMIWKRKGPMDILKNNRFLHMKETLARTVDAIVVNKMKEPLISKLSIYQVGGLPGHSILEHLLTLETVLARMEEIGCGFIFLVMDLVSFFDKEDIYDCLKTLETLQVNKKAARMWYLLNMNTKIAVKTAFGMTEDTYVGDCIGQGTAGAGLVSAANLDLGLQNNFNTSSKVMYFGDVRVQPLSYQDDVGTLCTSIEMAQCQATYLTKMLKEKTLHAHPDKSGLLLFGTEKFRENISNLIKKTPIFLDKFQLQTKSCDN